MEIFIIIIVAVVVFFVIPFLRNKIWTKATGLDKTPNGMAPDEKSLNGFVVISPEVKFKSFAISSRGQGRLFYTDKKRVFFTSMNGKEIGLKINFDQIQDLYLDEHGLFLKLIIRYSDEMGLQKSNSFKFDPTDRGIKLGDDKKYFEQWINELNKFRKG
jgi:hypothetical protein